MIDFRFYIPPHTKDTIDNFVSKGWKPGGFVRSVLANDFLGAFGAADENNTLHMRAIAAYVYNEVPMDCRGSYEAVEAWLDRFRGVKDEQN